MPAVILKVPSAAGSDTTANALVWWTLAMVAFPDVQRRAQDELDAVAKTTDKITSQEGALQEDRRSVLVRAVIRS